jgi:hypothetical protein
VNGATASLLQYVLKIVLRTKSCTPERVRGVPKIFDERLALALSANKQTAMTTVTIAINTGIQFALGCRRLQHCGASSARLSRRRPAQ